MLEEIKHRINTIKSINKTTSAMYLIAVSRSKKAREVLSNSKFYFEQIGISLSEILYSAKTIDSPYFGHGAKKNHGKILYIVFGADKGMAGSYDNNIIKDIEDKINKQNDELWVAGSMGRNKIKKEGYKVSDNFKYQIMNPSLSTSREVAFEIVNKYLDKTYHEINIIYTHLLTPINQQVVTLNLLPLNPEELLDKGQDFEHVNTLKYEPSAKQVFDHLVPHYLTGVIYRAFVEAFTSETYSRMYAMDNATKSATSLMDSLRLTYNRARQSEITQEINEIVAGIPN